MKLHELPAFRKQSRRRIGRGGKRGSYSGRGVKGQRSRAGRRIRPAFRDLISRIPKRRGFRNKPVGVRPHIVPLSLLARKLSAHPSGKSGSVTVDMAFLKQAGLMSRSYRGAVKILGNTSVPVPLAVRGLSVSKGAKIKIEEAGGTVSNE